MKALWIAASALIVYFLQSILYARYWKKGLQVRLQFTQEAIREGDKGELKEIVQNRKRLPLPFLQVNVQSHRSLCFTDRKNTALSDQIYRRDIYSLLPYQQIFRTLSFVGTKRGYYPCQEVELVGRTLFFEGPFVDKQPQRTALYVYPRAIPAEEVEAACQEMLGEYQWKKKLFEDPFSFRGIRDYGPGDHFRQVNWKASARTGELKVNVYAYTAAARVQILLNVRGEHIWTEELLLEGAIRIGAAMAERWIGLGIPVGIRTNGRDMITKEPIEVKPGAGPGHVVQILEALSRIELAGPAGTGWAKAGRLEQDGAGQDLARIEEDWLWKGWEEGSKNGEDGGLLLYIACSSREEDLKQLERIRQSGAVVRWIRPCTWRQQEQQRAERLEKAESQGKAKEPGKAQVQEKAGEPGKAGSQGKAKEPGKAQVREKADRPEMAGGQETTAARKKRPQDIYRGQIIEWRVEG